jgi:mannose-6-phosphate isomerase
VKLRRLHPTALEKVWGTSDTEPWFPRAERRTGEVWFTAPEEPRLLLKFLFTSGNLSVQVHPSDSDSGPGKTEMWHVLRAEPRSRVALGFEHPLSPAQARAAALSGAIENLLRWYPAQPGDTFFVPAGTVHAIGAGLALCEIQQHSDVTYRLYDYGRPRELHLEAGLAVADLGLHPGPRIPVDLGNGRRLLAECPYFRTESIVVTGELSHAAGPQAEFLVSIEGNGTVQGQPFAPGDVWIVLAGSGALTIAAPQPARLLRAFVPDNTATL